MWCKTNVLNHIFNFIFWIFNFSACLIGIVTKQLKMPRGQTQSWINSQFVKLCKARQYPPVFVPSNIYFWFFQIIFIPFARYHDSFYDILLCWMKIINKNNTYDFVITCQKNISNERLQAFIEFLYLREYTYAIMSCFSEGRQRGLSFINSMTQGFLKIR
jgi:hypothetical protein